MLSLENKILTLDEVSALAAEARGKIHTIYLHWTAGRYDQVFDDYHLCIGRQGQIYAPVNMNDLAEKKAHTWLRNSGAVGIALCSGFGATIRLNSPSDGALNGWQPYDVDFGYCPPTPLQVQALVEVISTIAREAGIYINSATVLTHAEVADLDGYGIYDNDPDMRWDLITLPWLMGVGGGE